jgi:anti-sigma B factor antagonist
MGDVMRAEPVRLDDVPGFAVEVGSDAVRSRVTLSGELDLASTPHLQQVLDQLCREGYPEIVLDLHGLKFLSAAGLTVFLRADDQLRDIGGRLILDRPGRLVCRMLTITELDTVLTIRETARSLDRATINGIAEVSSPADAAPAGTEPT